MSKEQSWRAGEGTAQPASVRDFWINATPVVYPVPELSRNAAPSSSSPSLWDEVYMQHASEGAWAAAEATPDATKSLRERLQYYGPRTLSNVELLSLVLRTGAGNEAVVGRIALLLSSYNMQQLLSADIGELSWQYGLGETEAAKLQAMLEVARRLNMPSANERYTITSPLDAARLLRPEMEHLDHEEIRALVLDTKNAVVANVLLYQGTVNSSVLRAAEVFRTAVVRKCPGLLVAHNHPSGDPVPSPEDEDITLQLVQAGKHLDVDLVDHIIIGANNRFVSLKERLRW